MRNQAAYLAQQPQAISMVQMQGAPPGYAPVLVNGQLMYVPTAALSPTHQVPIDAIPIATRVEAGEQPSPPYYSGQAYTLGNQGPSAPYQGTMVEMPAGADRPVSVSPVHSPVAAYPSLSPSPREAIPVAMRSSASK